MRFLGECSMRRREFITALGGMASATYWPSSVLAQQSSATRRISVLMSGKAEDKEAKDALAAFIRGLQQLGWTDGRNLRIDLRLGAGDADIIRKHAEELAALSPDLIVTYGSSAIGQLVQATRTVPILFVLAPDPV